ncbi:MAG: SiaB family protein kinase [Flavobacteriales bacterium]|nr:SiaB family protein kinase [Flavobacteriales bacterium]
MSKPLDKHILLNTDSILLEYEGMVNKAVLLKTLQQIETILDREGVDRQKKRKLANIAIETLQNLQLHSFPLDEHEYDVKPSFYLTKNDGCINVIIGNLIDNNERQVLEDKLNKINSLNEEEIKFLYGVIMKQTVVKFSSKGGAGLGLIDMKKKSGNQLDYQFQEIDNRVSYFSLKICVCT